MPDARKGKIARLPRAVRLEVNRRLRDGEPGPAICKWLNARPDVAEIMAAQFAGEPVKCQNLSEWRKGGFQDWLANEEKVDNIRRLADYSMSLAKAAGGNLSEGAAAIASGKILELLEAAEGEQILPMTIALSQLRNSDAKVSAAKTLKARLAQTERQLRLAEQKFQRQTAELFLEWYEKKAAQKIAESRESKQIKMDSLIQLMFGQRPEARRE